MIMRGNYSKERIEVCLDVHVGVRMGMCVDMRV